MEHFSKTFITKAKELFILFSKRENEYPCLNIYEEDEVEYQNKLKKVALLNKKIGKTINDLKTLEKDNGYKHGVSATGMDINNIPDVIYAAGVFFLLSHISIEVSRTVRDPLDVYSFLGERDAEKCLLLRESLSIDKPLNKMVHLHPSQVFKDGRLECKEEIFIECLPTLSEDKLLYLTRDVDKKVKIHTTH